jgi:hypothetical protein
MKLLTEMRDDIEFITENVGGTKQYHFQGVFIQTECQNGNGRWYTKPVMEREIARYTKDYINERRAFGELGHPAGPGINLPLVSHIITEMQEDGNNYIGKAKVLDTPNGKIVKNFLDEGLKIGVSSRALGSLTRKNGIDYVNEDLHLATAADIVADPSAPNAFVRGILEGADWARDAAGDWIPNFAEDSKKAYDRVHKIDQAEWNARLFEEFMNKLAASK